SGFQRDHRLSLPPRNVGIPLSADMPAPVNTTGRWLARSAATAAPTTDSSPLAPPSHPSLGRWVHAQADRLLGHGTGTNYHAHHAHDHAHHAHHAHANAIPARLASGANPNRSRYA